MLCLWSPDCAGVSQEEKGRWENPDGAPRGDVGGGDVEAQGSVLKGSNLVVRLFIVLSF